METTTLGTQGLVVSRQGLGCMGMSDFYAGRDDDRSVNELVDALDMSQPAVSKHLRVLRDAGLVEARVDAQRRVYSLRAEPLAEIDAWLAPYRELWNARLDALERHLDSSQAAHS